MAEREENGKFAKGNPGGPGRPKKEREERFYEITLSAVTFEDWKAIVTKAKQQAMRGDPTARKWLSDYLMGPPVQQFSGDIKHSIIFSEIIAGGDTD